jgi:hypothetical protein
LRTDGKGPPAVRISDRVIRYRPSDVQQRCADWPVRLERVQCGPLPAKAKTALNQVRAANEQNPGTQIREIAAYWAVGHA